MIDFIGEALWRVLLPLVLAAITVFALDYFELLDAAALVFLAAAAVWLVVINAFQYIEDVLEW